jgi:hypothetical protein
VSAAGENKPDGNKPDDPTLAMTAFEIPASQHYRTFPNHWRFECWRFAVLVISKHLSFTQMAFGLMSKSWLATLLSACRHSSLLATLLSACRHSSLLATAMTRDQQFFAPSVAAGARRARALATAGPWGLLAAVLRVVPAVQAPQVLRAAAVWAEAGMQGPLPATFQAPATQNPASRLEGGGKARRRRGCRGGRGRKSQQVSPGDQHTTPPAAHASQQPRSPSQQGDTVMEEPAAAAPPPAAGSAAATSALGARQLRQTTISLPRTQPAAGTSQAAATGTAPGRHKAPAEGLTPGFLNRYPKRLKATQGSPQVPMVGAALPTAVLPPVQCIDAGSKGHG